MFQWGKGRNKVRTVKVTKQKARNRFVATTKVDQNEAPSVLSWLRTNVPLVRIYLIKTDELLYIQAYDRICAGASLYDCERDAELACRIVWERKLSVTIEKRGKTEGE